MKKPPRPPLARPGEVWAWFSEARPTPAFYIIGEDHRSPRGQMHKGINILTGQVEDCFFSYDRFNGWEKIS